MRMMIMLGVLCWAMNLQTPGQTRKNKRGNPDATVQQNVPGLIPHSQIDAFSRCQAEGDYLYWLPEASAEVQRFNLDSILSSGTLVKTNTGIYDFAVDDKNLYYVLENRYEVFDGPQPDPQRTGDLRKLELASGQASTLMAGFKVGFGFPLLKVDKTHVYLVTPGKKDPEVDVIRVAKEGGTAETLASGLAPVSAFALDGEFVYWSINARTKGQIQKIAKTGGEITNALQGQVPESLMNATLLLADEKFLFVAGNKNIYRLDKATGEYKLLYNEGSDYVQAQDKDYIYLGGSKVVKINKATGNATVMAKVNGITRCLAVGDKYVFWGNGNISPQKGFFRSTK